MSPENLEEGKNQPINLTINQSIDQLNDQSINRVTDQSTNQSNNQSTDQFNKFQSPILRYCLLDLTILDGAAVAFMS
jgi:hypothetical protein